MQITTKAHDHILEMRISGRLDNEWAGHLTQAIDEAIRRGSHSLLLDLTGVSFLSSAGLGALVRAHKQFQSIHGFFGVGLASSNAAEVIRLTGLSRMLLCDPDQVRGAHSGSPVTIQPQFRVAADAGISWEIYELDAQAGFICEFFGDPGRMKRQTYREIDCRSIAYPANTLGLGLGAFGQTFSDCSNRFGEFLAVAGAAAQLPTSGAGKPDYQLSQGEFVPNVQVAYGLRCAGGFRHLLRFDSVEAAGRVPLSSLVEQCLALSETDVVSLAFVVESAGLIGTALRRSPALSPDEGSPAETILRFEHPEIRRWLSFSPDRSFSHSVALIVGVAARGDLASGRAAPLAPLLRPLRPGSTSLGHFHAAVFSYRPFKKRMLELSATVATLFDSEDLEAVLHLLHDDRAITGGGESELVRGACWLGPISQVTGASGS